MGSFTKCLYPRVIKNKWTGERMTVPCGRCTACRERRSNRYVQLLELERQCWRYCLFFTLTYNEDNVPRLRCYDKRIFCAPTNDHVFSGKGSEPLIFSLDDIEHFDDADSAFLEKHRYSINYLSVYDAQCFIKSLRQALKREHERRNGLLLENKKTDYYEDSFRYFLCGEYGAKNTDNYRPHYHGLLFFNSEFTASCIERLVDKTWKFGFTDTSFEMSNARNYVARYINSFHNLPKIYLYRRIRPFCIFSRCPALGSLIHNEEEVRKMFLTGATKHQIFDRACGKYDDVPFHRSYIDRLYPKIARFDFLSHHDRVRIYQSAKDFDDCDRYVGTVLGNYFTSDAYTFQPLRLYFQTCCDRFRAKYEQIVGFLTRLYYISRRVIAQASVFGITVDKYVERIEKFYSDVNYDSLVAQLKKENDYLKDGHPLSDLLVYDLAFLYECRQYSLDSCPHSMLTVLDSYGIDVNAFFDINEDDRDAYWNELDYRNTYDYISFKLNVEYYSKNNCKTKERHEYIGDIPY